MALKLYNSLTRKVDDFKPIKKGKVGLYHCGPTVYNFAHIGNLRAYIFADTLRRTLEFLDFKVTQVINITDIGHLSNDSDDGEDKMVKALKREGKQMTLSAMREIADFYTLKFKEDLKHLRILTPNKFPFASDHIKEDIEIISLLEKNGFAYKTNDGVYFDTNKMSTYGALGGTSVADAESRIGENSEKHSPRDFALWKFSSDIRLGFPSPWGVGFPGWHIECSAMARKYLGQPFDIHTGGVDHIAIHHNNEIAQSECAYNTKLANVWMHGAFLNIEGEKVAKSTGNDIYLKDIIARGIRPEGYRLWLLMAHYRTPVNFTWEALTAADTALTSLYEAFLEFGNDRGSSDKDYINEFRETIENDLDTPKAIALLFELIKNGKIKPGSKRATILSFDELLGLGFSKLTKIQIPENIQKLVKEREDARLQKNWKKSDELRILIEKEGFILRDETGGVRVLPSRISPGV